MDFFAVESARELEIEEMLKVPFFKVPFRIRSGQDDCTAYFAEPRFRRHFKRDPEFNPNRKSFDE